MRSMIDRRAFLSGLAALGAISATNAQQPKAVPRIGFLSAGAPTTGLNPWFDAFTRRLRELGYEDKRNITLEFRYAEGNSERLPELASELVRQKVDMIITTSTFAARGAKQATTTLPIVTTSFDAVADGLVTNLSRPGGNLTGTTLISTEIMGKRFQLLKETVPGVSRLGFLIQRREPGAFGTMAELEQQNRAYLESYRAAARPLGIAVNQARARGAEEIRSAFSELIQDRVQALYVIESPELRIHRALIAELAIQNRLPTIFGSREFVDSGGLMSYSGDPLEQARTVAEYVARILNGAKPGDLPIQQPTKFDLVINLKTAKALGLTIPPAVMARADEVIR